MQEKWKRFMQKGNVDLVIILINNHRIIKTTISENDVKNELYFFPFYDIMRL